MNKIKTYLGLGVAALILSIVALLVFTSGGGGSSSSASGNSTTKPTTTAPALSKDEAVIQEFTTKYPGVIVTDQQRAFLPRVAQSACRLIPSYLPIYPGIQSLIHLSSDIQGESATVFGSNPLTLNQSGYLLGGAITA